ncbi:hypothetical protein [Streptomyces inhibens]|nr:hypothetical protein [Streptomyces inhibens]
MALGDTASTSVFSVELGKFQVERVKLSAGLRTALRASKWEE